ncbi:MAG: UvrD-helicase domain-containing protein [Actinobacteria bacterium]|nr:UvrD-helicase domain-containing protein [Actinomycetota bacterium]
MELEKELNPQQLKAVLNSENSLLIFAGAGSGKTRVLTYKIAYLIKEKGTDPFKILAITFTNKAANEMKKRVISLVGKVGQYMWVSTFHSFCARLLRREISRLGYSEKFVIYDSDDSLKLISRCVADAGYDVKMVSPKSVQETISSAKNKLKDCDIFSKKAFDPFEKIVANIFPIYQNELHKANALDFDDLLLLTVNLLKLYPDAREKYQNQFQYILVDEFQDTNLVQNEIILLLYSGGNKIFVVGDDDQSIYSWRGAEVSNIINFDKNFSDTMIIKLEQNYRSTEHILDAANALIKNNYSRSKKRLWTENKTGELISKFRAKNEQEESKFIARKIRDFIAADGKKSFKDFAVFYRTNAQSRAIEEIFIRESVPYRIFGGLKFYDRKEIKDMLAYLKLTSNPKDVVSLMRVVNVPARGIGSTTISHIEKYSQAASITFCEAFYDIEKINTVNPSTRQKIKDFISTMDHLRDYLNDHSIYESIEELWEQTSYLKELALENTIESLNRIDNLKEFLTVVKEFEESHNLAEDNAKLSLHGFLQEISLVSEIDNYDENADTVTLMTLHNAKGLEFPVVFIVGLEEGIFPHVRSITGDYDEIEEERRLCYVGITRAKEKVFLTSSILHYIYGDQRERLISRFIGEIPDELFIDENKSQSLLYSSGNLASNNYLDFQSRKNQAEGSSGLTKRSIDIFSGKQKGYDKSAGSGFEKEKDFLSFKVGGLIEHKLWGSGEILRIKKSSDDLELDVVFKSVGLKKILASIAPIKKII